jgi:predicted protein tyrosine phosphatase
MIMKNKRQTKHKTYLFICMANMQRSPTAEDVARGLAQANGVPAKAKSAGISPLAEQPINRELAKEADLIFVMEGFMKQYIEESYQVEPGRIIVLGIPDVYERNEPQLVRILTEMLRPYFEEE